MSSVCLLTQSDENFSGSVHLVQWCMNNQDTVGITWAWLSWLWYHSMPGLLISPFIGHFNITHCWPIYRYIFSEPDQDWLQYGCLGFSPVRLIKAEKHVVVHIHEPAKLQALSLLKTYAEWSIGLAPSIIMMTVVTVTYIYMKQSSIMINALNYLNTTAAISAHVVGKNGCLVSIAFCLPFGCAIVTSVALPNCDRQNMLKHWVSMCG